MGCIATISHDKHPDQGPHYGRRVSVCFHFDASHTIGGTIVRDDAQEPYQTIIKTDDGRYLIATECQYRLID